MVVLLAEHPGIALMLRRLLHLPNRSRTRQCRPVRKSGLAIERLEARLAPAVNVLTFHNDTASTGLNAAELQLSPANVKVGSFGKLFTTPMDGQVYAEPLVYTEQKAKHE